MNSRARAPKFERFLSVVMRFCFVRCCAPAGFPPQPEKICKLEEPYEQESLKSPAHSSKRQRSSKPQIPTALGEKRLAGLRGRTGRDLNPRAQDFGAWS